MAAERLVVSAPAMLCLYEVLQTPSNDVAIQNIYDNIGSQLQPRSESPLRELDSQDEDDEEMGLMSGTMCHTEPAIRCTIAEDTFMDSEEMLRLFDEYDKEFESTKSHSPEVERMLGSGMEPHESLSSTQDCLAQWVEMPSSPLPMAQHKSKPETLHSDVVSERDQRESIAESNLTEYESSKQLETNFLLELEALLERDLSSTQGTDTSADQRLVESFGQVAKCTKQKKHLGTVDSSNTGAAIELPHIPDILATGHHERRARFCDRAQSAGFSKLEVRDVDEYQMDWAPFPSTGAQDFVSEKINSKDELLSNLLAQLRRSPRSDQLLWKDLGNKPFEADEENLEELDYPTEMDSDDGSGGRTDCTAPIQQQIASQDLSSPMSEIDVCSQTSQPVVQSTQTRDKTNIYCLVATENHAGPTGGAERADSISHTSSAFSASASLLSFLDLRGKKFSKSNGITDRKVWEVEDDPIECTPQTPNDMGGAHGDSALRTASNTKETNNVAEVMWHLPGHQSLEGPKGVVVDSQLVQSRPDLVQFCERSGQGLLTIIYRDFYEADAVAPDIILNPTSCLVITNMQSFMQKSLPGQAASKLSQARQKLISLAELFDTIVVLVVLPPLAVGDATSISDVSGFCSALCGQLSVSVMPIFVSNKTTEGLRDGLAAWVWQCITKYAFPTSSSPRQEQGGSIGLIQDETTWELFLRRAGVNVVAAQVLLNVMGQMERGCLHSESGTNVKEASGLGRIVHMSCSERMTRFGDIIGSRAVERLNLCIDSRL